MINKVKILYVGCINSDFDLVKQTLAGPGNDYDLLSAHNREDFTVLLTDFNPQVILSDDLLANFNTHDVLTLLEQNGSNTPVIAIGGTPTNAKLQHVINTMKHGACDYIFTDTVLQLPDFITQALEKCKDEKVTEALKRSEANLSAIIENTTDLVYSLDLKGRFITFNKLFKNTIKQVYGMHVAQGVNSADMMAGFNAELAEKWRGIYARALAGEPLNFVNKYPLPDGGAVFLVYSVNPILESGKVIGLSCFSRDITRQKLDEEYLKKSEASLRTIFNNTDMGCTLIDNDRKVVSFNMLAAKFCQGYHNNKLAEGQYIVDLATGNRRALISDILDQVSDGSSVNYQISHEINGAIHWFDLTWIGIKNEQLQDFGYLFTTKDITEKKKLEIEREQITTDLLHRNKDLEQFTYIVSHNLRAPVANIMGLALLLTDIEFDEPEANALVGGIHDSAERLDEVILDLNQILQADSRLNESIELVKLPLLINDIEHSIKSLIEKEAVTIDCYFEGVDSILTLKSFMYSIFFNLISNSIKYRKPNVPPAIAISTKMHNGYVHIYIRDNGRGIDTKKHGRDIFGLYKRFDTSVDGKGLGLFMVKMQVESLGGDITVQSELNAGTEFMLRFPVGNHAETV